MNLEPIEPQYREDLAEFNRDKRRCWRAMLIFILTFLIVGSGMIVYSSLTKQLSLKSPVVYLGIAVCLPTLIYKTWTEYRASRWKCPRCGYAVGQKLWNYRCSECHLWLAE